MAEPTVWDAYLGHVLRADGVDTGSLRDQLVAAESDVFRKGKSNVSVHDVSKEGTVVAFKDTSEADLQAAEKARPSSGTLIM